MHLGQWLHSTLLVHNPPLSWRWWSILTLRLRWWCCFNNQHKIKRLIFWYLYFVLVLVFDVLAFISLSVNSWWSDKSEMSPEWLQRYRRKKKNCNKNEIWKKPDQEPTQEILDQIGKQIGMKKEKTNFENGTLLSRQSQCKADLALLQYRGQAKVASVIR